MLNKSLDAIDRQILENLQNDARMRNVGLAEKVGLSPSPCLRRVGNLEETGVIRGYATLVDAEAVGLPVSVFVSVTLEKQIEKALEKFEKEIRARPEVMECYLMTGSSDYLVRIVVPDLQSFERFLADKLTRIPGVANIQSSFAVKQVVYNTELPLQERI